MSANVRPSPSDPAAVADQVIAFREAGAHVVSAVLPRPYDPGQLERLAPVLAELADVTA